MTAIPTQFRSVDPYSVNRFAHVLNRISRIVTGGQDMILFPDVSFIFTRKSDTLLTISSGLCVKDDVFIHITEDYDLDFSDDNCYLDDTPGMTAEGTYYVVLYYVWAESYPAKNAYYRIIKDRTLFLTYLDNYLFLGTINVVDDGGYKLGTSISYTDPSDSTVGRSTGEWDGLTVDGGVLPIS